MTGRRLVRRFTTALLLIGIAVFSLRAEEAGQKPKRKRTPQAVAVIDLTYIYKNYPQFKERMAELKLKVDHADAEVKEKQKAVEEMAAQLPLRTAGTPEYAELEKKITVAKAELAGSVDSQRKAFVRDEARLYNDAYDEILREVESYAKENGIAAVIRNNDQPINVGNPTEVLTRINRNVVWCDNRRDVTRSILQRLSKKPEAAESPQEAASPEEAEKK